jgi:hypothetical protein
MNNLNEKRTVWRGGKRVHYVNPFARFFAVFRLHPRKTSGNLMAQKFIFMAFPHFGGHFFGAGSTGRSKPVKPNQSEFNQFIQGRKLVLIRNLTAIVWSPAFTRCLVSRALDRLKAGLQTSISAVAASRHTIGGESHPVAVSSSEFAILLTNAWHGRHSEPMGWPRKSKRLKMKCRNKHDFQMKNRKSAPRRVNFSCDTIDQNHSFPGRFVRGMFVKGMRRSICSLIPLPKHSPATSGLLRPPSSLWLRLCPAGPFAFSRPWLCRLSCGREACRAEAAVVEAGCSQSDPKRGTHWPSIPKFM